MAINNLWGGGAALQHAQRRVGELEKQLDRYAKLRDKDAMQYNNMRTRALHAELKAEGYEKFFLWARAAYPEIVEGFEAVKKLEEFAMQPDSPIPDARSTAFGLPPKFYDGSSATEVWFDEMTDHDSLT